MGRLGCLFSTGKYKKGIGAVSSLPPNSQTEQTQDSGKVRNQEEPATLATHPYDKLRRLDLVCSS